MRTGTDLGNVPSVIASSLVQQEDESHNKTFRFGNLI
jgi:hypothetical protein